MRRPLPGNRRYRAAGGTPTPPVPPTGDALVTNTGDHIVTSSGDRLKVS
jgi:hypothetical protein